MADPVVFKNCWVGFTTSTGTTGFTELAGVKNVELPISKAELADAVMGDVAEVAYPGLYSAPLSLTCRQDFTTAAAGVDALLWNRWNNETAFKCKLKPVDAAVADDNPTFTLTKVRVFAITPISGNHGQLLENRCQLKLCSGGALLRSSST